MIRFNSEITFFTEKNRSVKTKIGIFFWKICKDFGGGKWWKSIIRSRSWCLRRSIAEQCTGSTARASRKFGRPIFFASKSSTKVDFYHKFLHNHYLRGANIGAIRKFIPRWDTNSELRSKFWVEVYFLAHWKKLCKNPRTHNFVESQNWLNLRKKFHAKTKSRTYDILVSSESWDPGLQFGYLHS